jgi:peptidoglycan hydrolase CwlO-like protein
MTGGKKIIKRLQDTDAEVLFAALENPTPMTAAELEDDALYRQTVRSMTDPLDLARLRALAEAAAKARAHHRKVQRASKTTPLESRQSVVALEDAVRTASEAMERDVPALLDRLEAAEARPPKLGNCGTYLAHDNKGQWHYLNHANTWQAYQAELDAADARIEELQAELQEQDEIINRLQRYSRALFIRLAG